MIELNHAKALAGDSTLVPPDAPGYPIEIRTPGSYRLTSDLQVPPGTDGISLMNDYVHLDLGGFAVRAPGRCFQGNCAFSVGSGVVHDPGGGGSLVTLRNGSVSGFGESCIRLSDGARVENVRVLHCGEYGIHLRELFPPGISHAAFGNHVSNTGLSSLVIEGGGLYRDNVLQRAGFALASPTIVGGTASGGNLCDDGRCSKRWTRRYYLTAGTFDGSQALNACDAGYHMASRWELMDRSSLEYDTQRGATTADSGTGPPSNGYGWARTGWHAETGGTVFGLSNCAAWTSSSQAATGTHLNVNWLWPGNGTNTPTWTAFPNTCDDPSPVWCIED